MASLELDRGTIEQKQFKQKLRGLLAFAQGPYQHAYGSPSLTIAFATTAGEHRQIQMRTWCEQILAEGKHQAQAEVFLFTHLPPGMREPRALFVSPTWWHPLRPQPVPLLDLSEEERLK